MTSNESNTVSLSAERLAELRGQRKAELDEIRAMGEAEGRHFVETASFKQLKYGVETFSQSYRAWEDNELDGLSSYFSELEDENGKSLLQGFDDAETESWFQGWMWAVGNLGEKVLAQV